MESFAVQPELERERLEALRSYAILDTPPERTFDRITSLAAEVFDVPLALITLVDETRSWWKSHLGTDVDHIDREISPCNLVIMRDEVVAVPDATLDAVYGALASFKAFGVRFYAAAPLHNQEGFNLGTLCVADPSRPHSCSERESRSSPTWLPSSWTNWS
jgi:GAF domain-containing protein